MVEDEESVLEAAKKMLQRLGYSALAARRPNEALGLALSHPGDIHILLTDLVMPQMNGRELAGRIKSLRPDIKVIYMSGYTAEAVSRYGILEQGVNFIQKPLTKIVLANKLRALLD